MESRPNRMPRFLIPLLLVVVVLAGWAWYKQREQPIEASVTAPDATATVPATTVANDAPGTGLPRPGMQGGSALNSADAKSLLSGRPQTAADRAKALADRDRQMAEFERSHRAEPVDAAWASEAKSNLDEIVVSEAIIASGIKPADYTADCRSATCRISADFKSSGDAEDWGTFFLASSGKTIRQAKMTIIQNPDGTSEVRIYGARR